MDTATDILGLIRGSQMARLFLVGFLGLVLGVPIVMIDALVGERQQRRDEAVAEVSSKWGGTQTVAGPALVVPFTHRWIETSDGKSVARQDTQSLVFFPARLRVQGALTASELARGIFTIPVYKMALTLDGEFSDLRAADLGVAPADVAWDRAQLALGIAEVRAIQEQVSVDWNGTRVAFLPGTGALADFPSGIHAPVAVNEATKTFTFSLPLALNGSLAAYFVPAAADTSVEITSNFPHPNFQGNWLPTRREVTDRGFSSAWAVPFLGRNYPQTWIAGSPATREAIDKSRFGVELANPIDPYRMADRSVKYAVLFVWLTFSTIWLVEVLGGVRVHPIQYLMIGAGLCLFYLLELSLSEHIPFVAAYAVATAAIVAMVGGYSLAILHHAGRAAVVVTGVAGLYAYLYVLLTNEDYALLIGAIGLFVALAAIMLVTRRVNWYAAGDAPDAPPAPTRS